MPNFEPGKVVKTFTTNSGQEAEVRYLKWPDLDQLLDYANTLSQEDTFVSLSGETISRKEEIDYLFSIFKEHELGNSVTLGCFISNQLVGLTNIDRQKKSRKRGLHIGHLGLSVHQDFRGDGVGFILAKTVITEAKDNIEGLRLIVLSVFGINQAGINLYQKLGFKQYGSLEEGIEYQGKYVPHNHMVLRLT